MGDMVNLFKVAGFVLAGVAVVFVLGLVGFFWVKRKGALRGE